MHPDLSAEERVKGLGWQITLAEVDEVGSRGPCFIAYGRELRTLDLDPFTSPHHTPPSMTRTGKTRDEAALNLLAAISDWMISHT